MLIHAAVRGAIEAAVEAELAATLGAGRYERRDSRQGYRNGTKPRTLSGPTGALALYGPTVTIGHLLTRTSSASIL
jgi:putative transposase